MCEQILKKHSWKNSRNDSKEKVAQFMAKQLQQLLWTLNLNKCHKNVRKNRNGIQNPKTSRKKLEKLNDFFNSKRKHKAE